MINSQEKAVTTTDALVAATKDRAFSALLSKATWPIRHRLSFHRGSRYGEAMNNPRSLSQPEMTEFSFLRIIAFTTFASKHRQRNARYSMTRLSQV